MASFPSSPTQADPLYPGPHELGWNLWLSLSEDPHDCPTGLHLGVAPSSQEPGNDGSSLIGRCPGYQSWDPNIRCHPGSVCAQSSSNTGQRPPDPWGSKTLSLGSPHVGACVWPVLLHRKQGLGPSPCRLRLLGATQTHTWHTPYTYPT